MEREEGGGSRRVDMGGIHRTITPTKDKLSVLNRDSG